MQENQPMAMVRQQQDIVVGERITRAIRVFFSVNANAIMGLFLAPVLATRTLFTTKEEILVPMPFPAGPQGHLNQAQSPDEDETWMKEHKEQYEDD